jgi:hypothetical protein
MARFVIDARCVRSRPSGIGSYVSALIERLPSLAPEEQLRLWTHPERSAPVIAPNLSPRAVSADADGARKDLEAALRRAHEIIGSNEPYHLVVDENEPYEAHACLT